MSIVYQLYIYFPPPCINPVTKRYPVSILSTILCQSCHCLQHVCQSCHSFCINPYTTLWTCISPVISRYRTYPQHAAPHREKRLTDAETKLALSKPSHLQSRNAGLRVDYLALSNGVCNATATSNSNTKKSLLSVSVSVSVSSVSVKCKCQCKCNVCKV